MSESYKGITVPVYSDAADGPAAFRALVDSGPIPRFANVAARDAAFPAPVKGQVVWRDDATGGAFSPGAVEVYDGTIWRPAIPAVPPHSHVGTDITSDIALANVPNLPATIITSGTLASARLPAATTSVVGGVRLGDASNEAAPGNHLHDTRYYTESQVNSLLGGKANTSHSHNYLPLSGNNNTSVGGTVVFPGTVYFNVIEANKATIGQLIQGSSLDYKTDIGAVELRDSVFERVRPISFRYRELYADKNIEGKRMGFSYEDFIELAPEWAVEMSGGLKGIDYWGLLPDFMGWAHAAINDLREKLSAHERAALA